MKTRTPCTGYYLFDRRSPVTPSQSRVRSAEPFLRKPAAQVISHRSRCRSRSNLPTSLVIYNDAKPSVQPPRLDSLFSQLCTVTRIRLDDRSNAARVRIFQIARNFETLLNFFVKFHAFRSRVIFSATGEKCWATQSMEVKIGDVNN